MDRVRALAGRLLLSVVTLAAGLLLLELGLRAMGVARAEALAPIALPGLLDAGEAFCRSDDLLIYSIAPHARTYEWFQIDGHGFRTPEFSDRKPPGTLRIVVTGDSTTFALGVLEEQRWSSVLRRALAGLFGDVQPIEVINAGVPGYSTLQNRLQIQRDLLPLQPDLIIVLVTGGNDATLIEGPGDAQVVEARNSLGGRLANTRIARLLGSRAASYGSVPPRASAGSPTARPRVSVPEVRANLHAMAGLLPGRVIFGIFQSQFQRAESADVDRIADTVRDVAVELHVPLADSRRDVEDLLPYPLYLDTVHPTVVGHEVIARSMLAAVLQTLELPQARRAWANAFLAARGADPGADVSVAGGAAGPPRFREILALYERADIDLRLAAGEAGLPPAALDWDPVVGRACAARSLFAADRERRREIRTWIRPDDPLLAFCPDPAAGALPEAESRPSDRVASCRAASVFAAELGLPARRLDLRRGAAMQAGDPAAAIVLLDAVLALDPGDSEARYDRAWQLRHAGRRKEARSEFRTLAAGTGPLSDFARGLLAHESLDQPAAEAALRTAIAGAPALGHAHEILGQIFLEQNRYEEAVREIMLGSVLLGSVEGLPARLAEIEAQRREAAVR